MNIYYILYEVSVTLMEENKREEVKLKKKKKGHVQTSFVKCNIGTSLVKKKKKNIGTS